ncbi:hypothetical protein [Micromonospora zamorensis]|uniref:hypothetical protein n=1 Tax=Micromonospora zamorensis TaxID=709883 RepID=UPI0033BB8053
MIKASGFPELNRAERTRYFTMTGADEAFVRPRTGRNVRTGWASIQTPTQFVVL